MKTKAIISLLAAAAMVVVAPHTASAHCDTMDGPVITAARRALDSGNVNLALIWVQPGDEAALQSAFDEARAARQAGGAEKDVAARRFYEALVRIHRGGEGAPFTGIKPEGTDVGPAVAAADESLAAGSVDATRTMLTNAVQSGIERHFRAVMDRRNYDPNDVAAGRAYVKAYVAYTHYAEGLYDTATATVAHHEHASAAHRSGHEGHGARGIDEHHGHESHANHILWPLTILLGLGLVLETGWIVRQRRRNQLSRNSPAEQGSTT